ncbi:prolipoprotein diacylglyceryl transferase [Kosmotoga pacifica]|uniref:Phosphatidylglycerol--prolipoprotein diacylglyceryl transferase n=1 Tax=Kosmotoga pacifica TaxID=1330330 RepID=A0A0G2ZCM4_9BACT|nr:prolipoprotein diacylglyceryl transferase [Kosmotoga pacifica]AKI97851.1 diacylglyceryl transferase [Kosmotoga pacifica]
MKKSLLFFALAFTGIILLGWFVVLSFSGRIVVNPILLKLGPFEIRWYGFLIASAIFVAYLLGKKLALKEGIKEDHLIEMIFWGIIAGIIGARLYYVAFEFELYREYPMEIFRIWNGGLAIHGAIFGALLSGFLYTRLKKSAGIKFLQASDIFTSVLPLAQAIGRWGNFMNHEAYGAPTDLPWKMYVPLAYRMPGFREFEYFHPTFLYESLWDLFVFFIVFNYTRKFRKNYGETTGLYMVLYSAGRYFIEALRLDSLIVGQFRTAQVVSIILMICGAFLYLYSKRKGEAVRIVS